MPGIVSYGAYLPYWRLQRGAIGQTLGAGGGKGTRSVASYDEDSTSMGVEAGRAALAGAPDGYAPGLLAFATTAPTPDRIAPTASNAGTSSGSASAAWMAVAFVLSAYAGAVVAKATTCGL